MYESNPKSNGNSEYRDSSCFTFIFKLIKNIMKS